MASANAKNYERLYLEGNPLGDAAAGSLAEADLPNLGDLNLDEIRMSPGGALALTESRGFAGIAGISLQGNRVSADVLKQFGRRVIL